MSLKLIFCLAGNRGYMDMARQAGWWPGARLPGTIYGNYQPLAFVDQQWTRFAGLYPGDGRYDRAYQRYITAVLVTRPQMASVIDWTPDRSLDEVLTWGLAIAPYVQAVQIIPKVPGSVAHIPHTIGGVGVALGFSVPTRHGATPCDPAEFASWPVHLLGGNPRQQIMYAGLLAYHGARVMSADGNLTHKAAGRGTFWQEALRRSLVEVPRLWRAAGWVLEAPPELCEASV
jgi:uncharacterized protein DUF6610